MVQIDWDSAIYTFDVKLGWVNDIFISLFCIKKRQVQKLDQINSDHQSGSDQLGS